MTISQTQTWRGHRRHSRVRSDKCILGGKQSTTERFSGPLIHSSCVRQLVTSVSDSIHHFYNSNALHRELLCSSPENTVLSNIGRKTCVVALCVSLRNESKTRIALNEALEAAGRVGATTDLVDLRSYDLPPFDADNRSVGDAKSLQLTVQEAKWCPAWDTKLPRLIHRCVEKRPQLLRPRRVQRNNCRVTGSRRWGIPGTGTSPPPGGLPSIECMDTAIRSRYPGVTYHDYTGRDHDSKIAGRVEQLGDDLVTYAGVDRFPRVVDRPNRVAADGRM